MPKRQNDPVLQWLVFSAFGKSQFAATNGQLSTSSRTATLVWQCVTSDGGYCRIPTPRHSRKQASKGCFQQPGVRLGAHPILRDCGTWFGESTKLTTFSLNYHGIISKLHLLAAIDLLHTHVHIMSQPGGQLHSNVCAMHFDISSAPHKH